MVPFVERSPQPMKFRFAARLIVPLVIFLVYASVWAGGSFGVNDDYQYLQRVFTDAFHPASNEQTGMGRPVAAWMLAAAYGSCRGSVANLVFLRVFSLIGVVFLAMTLRRTLRRVDESEHLALAVAAAVAFSPAGGVYAGWAAAFVCPYALVLCLVAGSLLGSGTDARRVGWWRVAGAALLILLAANIWQAAVPMALFMGMIDVWRRSDRGEPFRGAIRASGLISTGLIVGATVLVYLIGQHLALRFGWVTGAGRDRLALATDPAAKAALLLDLLCSGFASWARLHSLRWEIPVAVLTFAAIAGTALRRPSGEARRPAEACSRFLAAAAMLGVSVSPMLAASENNASFRSLPMLYAVIGYLAVKGAGRWRPVRSAGVRTAACVGLILALAWSAAYHVRAGIVLPNRREYGAVRRLVGQQFREMPRRLVYLVPPAVLLAPDSMKPSWEYGIVSSPFSWVTKPFLLLVFHAEGMCPYPDWGSLDVSFREAGHPPLPVLNPLAAMLHEQGAWRDDARFGRLLVFSGGWVYSPWFGYLNIKDFPLLQHHILGSIICLPGATNDLWLFKQGLGVFFTSQVAFPSLYVSDRRDWVYLLDTDRSHCAVSDANGQQQLLSGQPPGVNHPIAAATAWQSPGQSGSFGLTGRTFVVAADPWFMP